MLIVEVGTPYNATTGVSRVAWSSNYHLFKNKLQSFCLHAQRKDARTHSSKLQDNLEDLKTLLLTINSFYLVPSSQPPLHPKKPLQAPSHNLPIRQTKMGNCSWSHGFQKCAIDTKLRTRAKHQTQPQIDARNTFPLWERDPRHIGPEHLLFQHAACFG